MPSPRPVRYGYTALDSWLDHLLAARLSVCLLKRYLLLSLVFNNSQLTHSLTHFALLNHFTASLFIYLLTHSLTHSLIHSAVMSIVGDPVNVSTQQQDEQQQEQQVEQQDEQQEEQQSPPPSPPIAPIAPLAPPVPISSALCQDEQRLHDPEPLCKTVVLYEVSGTVCSVCVCV